MKRKKAALYNPYIDTLGGGEKHILSIMKVLDDNDTDITVFWNHNLTEEIKQKFNLKFNHLSFAPNIFKMKHSVLKKIQALKKYDYFFYVTDGSYFLSSAKKNYVFAMVPDQRLYTQTFANKLKTFNYRFICNSKFTQNCLSHYGLKATVCYPYIDDAYIHQDLEELHKEDIILSVARFFPQLHTKKQDILIKTFVEMKNQYPALARLKLILAGGLKYEDRAYFNHLQKLATGRKDIEFKTNITSKQIYNLYSKSRYFWHFTGYGENDQSHPEKVEHLGISPLEAMSMGCIPFCFEAGGPKEIIQNETNGFLFETKEELIKQFTNLLKNKTREKAIRSAAKAYVINKFSYDVFKRNVMSIL